MAVSRAAATFGGVLVLALVAGGLTEASLALGHRGGLVDDTALRPAQASPSVSASPSVAPTPSATPTPAATPAPTPTPTPAAASATTNSFVHLRAAASTSSSILVDLDGGTKVQLLPYVDAQWQQVQYGSTVGYVFKSYLAY